MDEDDNNIENDVTCSSLPDVHFIEVINSANQKEPPQKDGDRLPLSTLDGLLDATHEVVSEFTKELRRSIKQLEKHFKSSLSLSPYRQQTYSTDSTSFNFMTFSSDEENNNIYKTVKLSHIVRSSSLKPNSKFHKIVESQFCNFVSHLERILSKNLDRVSVTIRNVLESSELSIKKIQNLENKVATQFETIVDLDHQIQELKKSVKDRTKLFQSKKILEDEIERLKELEERGAPLTSVVVSEFSLKNEIEELNEEIRELHQQLQHAHNAPLQLPPEKATEELSQNEEKKVLLEGLNSQSPAQQLFEEEDLKDKEIRALKIEVETIRTTVETITKERDAIMTFADQRLSSFETNNQLLIESLIKILTETSTSQEITNHLLQNLDPLSKKHFIDGLSDFDLAIASSRSNLSNFTNSLQRLSTRRPQRLYRYRLQNYFPNEGNATQRKKSLV